MSPPISLLLPSRLYNPPNDFPQTAAPLLITSHTASQLITLSLTHAAHSKTRHILITSQPPSTFPATLTSSLLTHASSPLNSSRAIITADTVTVYHVSTLAQLRVLLSSLQHSKCGFLAVDGFLPLHQQAEEFSAQGISRTLAAMVQIVSSAAGVLVLREAPEMIGMGVPILNAGVTSGIAGATAPVLRVLGRWVRGFWNQEVDGEGENVAEWICRGEKWRVTWTLREGEIDDVQQIPLVE